MQAAKRTYDPFVSKVKVRKHLRTMLPHYRPSATVVLLLVVVALSALLFGAIASDAGPMTQEVADTITTVATRISVRTSGPIVTWTPSPTPVQTATPTQALTATPWPAIDVPNWMTLDRFKVYASIVEGETYTHDMKVMIFIATQILYDAQVGKGVVSKGRWKASKEPSHEAMQAVDIALRNIDDPLWPKCTYVLGLGDSEWALKITSGKMTPDVAFGDGKHGVIGWGCE